jgi:hypothetical protein
VSAESFARSIERLLNEVGHWEQGRWWSRPSAPGGPAPPTRGDLAYKLVQRLADHGADAEDRPHRPVPRENDLVLADQIRVLADDLLAAEASDEQLRLAIDEVEALRRTL